MGILSTVFLLAILIQSKFKCIKIANKNENQKSDIIVAVAATNISPVAIQPKIVVSRPFCQRPIILRLELIFTIKTKITGAIMPLSTAE